MPKKKIMRALKINEISVVDKPAQEGAKLVIMKRHEKIVDEDLVEKGSILLSDEMGHSHLIYCLESGGGTTSYTRMPSEDEGDGVGHDHPYIITDEGKVVVGEAEGHTHSVRGYGKVTVKKREAGKDFGPSDYAYTPDFL